MDRLTVSIIIVITWLSRDRELRYKLMFASHKNERNSKRLVPYMYVAIAGKIWQLTMIHLPSVYIYHQKLLSRVRVVGTGAFLMDRGDIEKTNKQKKKTAKNRKTESGDIWLWPCGKLFHWSICYEDKMKVCDEVHFLPCRTAWN